MNESPIRIPAWITREFIKKHENEYIFLYSSPVNMAISSQAEHVLDSCCYPVPVKWSMCLSSGGFQDDDNMAAATINDWINDIPLGKPVIPFPNMGQGKSRLKERAPRLWKLMDSRVQMIAYPNIVYYREDITPYQSDLSL